MDDFQPVNWPLNVWYIMSAISVPVYIIVLVSLLRLRCYSKTYNTTFYTLLLQHSIADLLTMTVFFVSQIVRNIQSAREFVFDYQDYYIAPATYNTIYYFLYIRCCGIILLTSQRYMIIAAPTSHITQIIQEAKNWKIVVVYWTIPTLLSLVVLKDTAITFDDMQNMAIVIDKSIIMRNTTMTFIVTSITCIFCTTTYILLYYYIRTNTTNLNQNLRREMHLAVQVLILLLGLFTVLVWSAFQNYYSRTYNSGPVYFMRSMYPLPNGILSYLNPFCILFLNRDFSKHVWKSVTCGRMNVSDTGLSTHQAISTRQTSRKILKVRAAV